MRRPQRADDCGVDVCVNPGQRHVLVGPNWVLQYVGCRKCWECREDRKRQHVGAMLMEQSTCHATAFVTATYRDCPEREVDQAHKILVAEHKKRLMDSLRYRLRKDWLKRLETDPDARLTRVTYKAAGEYGSKNGRAHWHFIFFFDGPVPPEILKAGRFQHYDWWPHGHVDVKTDIGRKAMKYVSKYAVKGRVDDDPAFADMRQTSFGGSTRPMVGLSYVLQRAALDHAMASIPQAMEFKPPGMALADETRTSWALRNGRKPYVERWPMSRAMKEHYLLERHRLACLDALDAALPPMEYPSEVLARAPETLKAVGRRADLRQRREAEKAVAPEQALEEWLDRVARKRVGTYEDMLRRRAADRRAIERDEAELAEARKNGWAPPPFDWEAWRSTCLIFERYFANPRAGWDEAIARKAVLDAARTPERVASMGQSG